MDATSQTTGSRSRAGGSTTSRLMTSGFASQRRSWRRFTTSFSASPGLTLCSACLWLNLKRDPAAMAWLFPAHLGVVMALFATLAYRKFVLGIYRAAALLKAAIEKRQKGGVQMGSE